MVAADDVRPVRSIAPAHSEAVSNRRLPGLHVAFSQTPANFGALLPSLSMCFWITFLRQWSGINLIVYYLAIILTSLGLSGSLITLLAGIVTTWFFLGTIPLVFTVEKFGRRKIMLTGTIIETLCMLTFIILIAIPNPTPGMQWASFAVICAFVFTFGYSTAGMIWLYSVEIPPLEYRHIGSSLSSFGEWLATFLTTFAAPIGLTNVGWPIYIWILVGDILFVAFVFFLCPESKHTE